MHPVGPECHRISAKKSYAGIFAKKHQTLLHREAQVEITTLQSELIETDLQTSSTAEKILNKHYESHLREKTVIVSTANGRSKVKSSRSKALQQSSELCLTPGLKHSFFAETSTKLFMSDFQKKNYTFQLQSSAVR